MVWSRVVRSVVERKGVEGSGVEWETRGVVLSVVCWCCNWVLWSG